MLSKIVSATLGIITALGHSRTRRRADESLPGSVRPPAQTVASAIPEDGDDPERADASAAFAVNAVGPDAEPGARPGFSLAVMAEESRPVLRWPFRPIY